MMVIILTADLFQLRFKTKGYECIQCCATCMNIIIFYDMTDNLLHLQSEILYLLCYNVTVQPLSYLSGFKCCYYSHHVQPFCFCPEYCDQTSLYSPPPLYSWKLRGDRDVILPLGSVRDCMESPCNRMH